jgi:hypothetical protein
MNAFIKTDETTSVIQADTLIAELNATHLYAYLGDKLVGMWRMSDIKSAYLTESRAK